MYNAKDEAKGKLDRLIEAMERVSENLSRVEQAVKRLEGVSQRSGCCDRADHEERATYDDDVYYMVGSATPLRLNG